MPGAPGYPSTPPTFPSSQYYFPTAKPPRRRTGLMIVLIVVLVAIVGSAVAYALPRALSTGASSGPSASGSKGSGKASPTPPPDLSTIDGALKAQATALLAGNQDAFLAEVDPGQPTAVADFNRLYHNLRQLQVKTFSQHTLYQTPLTSAPQTFEVQVAYCLLVTDCGQVTTTWTVTATLRGGKASIESYTAPERSSYAVGPLPWEVTTLTAVTGPRVIVAASSLWSSKLSYALPIAERAAKAADQYARWGKPAVYVVYLAANTEGDKWFGGGLTEADGVTYTISPSDLEVVADMPYADSIDYAGPGRLATVIQHEFGHVATLQGSDGRPSDDFVEGIAEYCAYTGHTAWAAYRLDDVRAYISRGKWSHQAYLTSEIRSDDALTGSAAYGIGYLTIRYLASTYGTAKMLEFWGEVERDSESLDVAAENVLGKSWPSVNAAAVRYIESAVGL